MKKNRIKHVVSLLTLLAFGFLALGSGETGKSMDSAEPDFTLTANELYQEYKSNEVAADVKYKNKVVALSGRIQDIGKDILDNMYVVIGGQYMLDGVQCTFNSDQQEKVAQLTKGQVIKVKGKVQAKMGNVQVKSCVMQ